MVPPGVQGYSKDADKRPAFDKDKAKKLLADAGYPNGFGITLDCGNIQPAADICQAIPPMLSQVGIRATAEHRPASQRYFPKIQKFDTSMYLLSWGGRHLRLALQPATADPAHQHRREHRLRRLQLWPLFQPEAG